MILSRLFSQVASIHSRNLWKPHSANDRRDKMRFEAYLQQQLNKIDIPDKDETFLRTKMLEMYSNPLKNHWEYKQG